MSVKPRQSVRDMSLWVLTWPLFVELLLTFSLGVEDSFYLAKISDQAADDPRRSFTYDRAHM